MPAEALPDPARIEVITDDALIEGLRSSYEVAYNALPLDEALPTESYQALFSPVFEQANESGAILRRSPVMSADGFTLSEEERTTPGHSLLVDVITATDTYCLASTQAISPDYVPDVFKNLISELPHEFIVVKGSCAPHATLLASVYAQ